MTVLPFPPPDAGLVLAEAFAAALSAARAEAAAQGTRCFMAWTDPYPDDLVQIEQAALNAATPILRLLTADALMPEIVAVGMVQEVMIRLDKGDAA